ncbi:hypothetical protein Q9966_008805 [Columba livia]|nr:hypothetical protein Q9966_008805 [Columba livia]
MVHCVLAILGEAGLSHVVFGLCTGQVRILEVDLILPIKNNQHLKVCSRYTKVKLSCLIVLKGDNFSSKTGICRSSSCSSDPGFLFLEQQDFAVGMQKAMPSLCFIRQFSRCSGLCLLLGILMAQWFTSHKAGISVLFCQPLGSIWGGWSGFTSMRHEKDYCMFLAKPEVCLKPDCPVCLFAGLEQTGEQYGWMLELATAGIVTIILFTFCKICGNFQVLQELTHEEKMRELRKDMAGAGMLCTDGSEIAVSQLVQPWTLDLQQPTRGSSSCNKC